MPKKLIPMVLKPSVRPLKYYDMVGDIMINFLAGRKVAVIRQVGDSAVLMTRVKHEDGSRLPILINNKNDLIWFVKMGGVDFMASVNQAASKGIDTVIIDIKGSRKAWMLDRGLEYMDLVTAAVRAALEYLGLVSNAVFFDGMNGFKVAALLKDEVSVEELRALSNIVSEAVSRSVKLSSLYHVFNNEVLIGDNTMLKVKMFRVPYSLHWSTKLSAIPIPRVYDFTTLSADPSNVIMRLDTGRKLLEPLMVRNPIDKMMDSIRRFTGGDYSLIYELKGFIKGRIMRGGVGSLGVDRENLKTD